MKRFFTISLLILLTGCASIHIPNYIQDKHPYKRTIYAPYEKVHEATIASLREYGWIIMRESDPAQFERSRETEDKAYKQTLLFTQVRQFSFVLGTQYTRLNVYLSVTSDNGTEVEIRYIKVTSSNVKSFMSYKSDEAIERILKGIEQRVISS